MTLHIPSLVGESSPNVYDLKLVKCQSTYKVMLASHAAPELRQVDPSGL